MSADDTNGTLPGFQLMKLGCEHRVWTKILPQSLILSSSQFETLWTAHPSASAEIRMHDKWVKIPRWQQAYGVDYRFSGQVSKAVPIPELLTPLLVWARKEIDERLNGVLLNWYDADLGHYIGRHRDSIEDMLTGAPIVTFSFGEPRLFRLRPWRYSENTKWDFVVKNGSVVVIPFDTNLAFTHEVVRSRSDRGRRISVTLRAFRTEGQ